MNKANKTVNCTFSLDKSTIKILEETSNNLHQTKSAFLRLLIWNHYNRKKEGI